MYFGSPASKEIGLGIAVGLDRSSRGDEGLGGIRLSPLRTIYVALVQECPGRTSDRNSATTSAMLMISPYPVVSVNSQLTPSSFTMLSLTQCSWSQTWQANGPI